MSRLSFANPFVGYLWLILAQLLAHWLKFALFVSVMIAEHAFA